MNEIDPPAARDHVFVVGEALIDLIVDGDRETAHPGGSPMNVAFGLGRLDVPTTLRTQIGTDDQGRDITRHLACAGVQLDPRSLGSAPTSRAVATLHNDGHADYIFELSSELDDLVAPADATVIHTGSIATVLEPSASRILALLSAGTKALISFDPNVRPQIATDRDAAVQRFAEFAERAHVVKLSDEDAKWLFPGFPLHDVTSAILDMGPSFVAITRGSEGCQTATSGGLTAEFPAPPVHVVDTVGAGDAFMAGLLFAMINQRQTDTVRAGSVDAPALQRIVEVALACAKVAVSRAGANPPSTEELRAALG